MGFLALAGLPLTLYRQFSIEQRFGFNRMTASLFVVDTLKSWLLGGCLVAVLVLAILATMQFTGSRWWLVAWLGWLATSLLMVIVWPRWIAPLFNRFTPLTDHSLRASIDALLSRHGFAVDDVFVMDGSRRSAHGNAYFTGFGRHKRIVFFDTLLNSLTPAQVVAVLAHELAHFRLHHIGQRLAVMSIVSLAGFALLAWLGQQPWFYSALGVDRPGDAAALLLMGLGFYMLHNTFQAQVTEVAPGARASAVALHAFSFFSGQALGVILMGFGLHSVGLTGATAIAALIVMGVGLVASYVLTRPAAQRAR